MWTFFEMRIKNQHESGYPNGPVNVQHVYICMVLLYSSTAHENEVHCLNGDDTDLYNKVFGFIDLKLLSLALIVPQSLLNRSYLFALFDPLSYIADTIICLPFLVYASIFCFIISHWYITLIKFII